MLDEDHFVLLAIDDKMKILWRTPLDGTALSSGKLGGHLVALALTPESKKSRSSYTTYLIDDQTGKVLQQKAIYPSNDETKEVSDVTFAKDGTWLKLLVRVTGTKKSAKFILDLDKFKETRELTLISINDQMETTITQPGVPEGLSAMGTATAADNYFLFSLLPDGKLKAIKLVDGKTGPVANIVQDIDMPAKWDHDKTTYSYATSATDPNVVYFSVIHKNPAKDVELTVCKLDFNNNTGKSTNEPLTRAHLKSIEKSFVSPNSKLDNADIGSPEVLHIKGTENYDGVLVVTYGTSFSRFNSIMEEATVINGYDADLNPKFQQVMPTFISFAPTEYPGLGYHAYNHTLYVTANNGSPRFKTLLGQLDLGTGKWLRLEQLGKDKIDGSDYITGNNLWYPGNFILIYVPFTSLWNGRVDLSMQLNSY